MADLVEERTQSQDIRLLAKRIEISNTEFANKLEGGEVRIPRDAVSGAPRLDALEGLPGATEVASYLLEMQGRPVSPLATMATTPSGWVA